MLAEIKNVGKELAMLGYVCCMLNCLPKAQRISMFDTLRNQLTKDSLYILWMKKFEKNSSIEFLTHLSQFSLFSKHRVIHCSGNHALHE